MVLNLSFSKLRLFKAGVSGQRKTANNFLDNYITLPFTVK